MMTADQTPERTADEPAAVAQEPGLYDERPGIDVTGDTDPADIRHGQREIPADELAEADEVEELEEELQGTSQLLTNMVDRAEQAERERDAARAEVHAIGLALGLRPAARVRLDGDAVHDRAIGITAEVERLREELERAQKEAARAWSVAGGGRCECGEVVTLTKDGRLTEHEDDGTRCEWSGTRDHEPPNIRIRVLDADDRRELERLRARDEAAQTVVRALCEMRANESLMRSVLIPSWLLDALDALARAHEDGGNGR